MESKIFRLKRIRAQVRRLLPILFLFLILLMMLLVRSNNPALVRTRSAVGDFFLPVISFVRQPVYWVKNAADGIKDWVLTYHENKVLKEENENLKQWHMKA